MSRRDPLNLMGNPYQPNPWLNQVPKVQQFQCEICRWAAPTLGDLTDHNWLIHEFRQIRPISPIPDSPPTSPERINPPSASLSVQSSVKSNTPQLKPIDVWSMKCNLCGLGFSRRNNISRHMKYSCPKNPNSAYSNKKKSGIKCNFCDKYFSNRSNMMQHVNNKH